ncbi:MAG: gliding motility-associated C-terminal domain-containing protein [Cytophagaceae bacterium]
MLPYLRIIILSFLIIPVCQAQLRTFATLQGNPINTNGWEIIGSAYAGNVSGGSGTPELILADIYDIFQAGGVFFEKQFNSSSCNQWEVSFDFRIFDGEGADGLAFCFFEHIPFWHQMEPGGSIGIPYGSAGLAVVFDPYRNRVNSNYSDPDPVFCGVENPEIQIFHTDGQKEYSECNDDLLRVGPVSEIRRPQYNTVRITYNNGSVEVFMNGQSYLEGYFPVTISGYFGFTGSSGGRVDNHSIKNVEIKANIPLAANAGEDKRICSGTPVVLGSNVLYTPDFQVAWMEGNNLLSNSDRPELSLFNNGSSPINREFTLVVNQPGSACTNTDNVKIEVLPLPSANAGSDKEICIGQRVEIGGESVASINEYTVVWSPSSGLSSSTLDQPVAEPEETTTYTVTVSDKNGCSHSDQVIVNVIPIPLPEVELTPPFELCEGESAAIQTIYDETYNYLWNTGDVSSSISISGPGLYWVDVRPEGGCTIRDSVYISYCPPEVNTSNLFTPNGDGLNDVFKIQAKNYQDFELTIYNRWGSLVFHSTDSETGWDGKKYSEGVYYWNVKVKGFDDYEYWRNFKGILTLFRSYEQKP